MLGQQPLHLAMQELHFPLVTVDGSAVAGVGPEELRLRHFFQGVFQFSNVQRLALTR